MPVRARRAAASLAIWSRTAWASALPSMMCAGITSQIVLAGRGRQLVVRDMDPNRFAGFLLVLDVQVRGRIVADQDRRQARFDAGPRQKGRGVLGDLVPDRLGERFAIDDVCRHHNSLSARCASTSHAKRRITRALVWSQGS